MPRLPPSFLQRAHLQDPLLPLLLRECRDLASARNELRWLREHAIARYDLARSAFYRDCTRRKQDSGDQLEGLAYRSRKQQSSKWRELLRILVKRRAEGEPLQYILGTQPFGDLEILCKRGALIPRPETEAYTLNIAGLVRKVISHQPVNRIRDGNPDTNRDQHTKLRILDVCTGTGCIPLLLYSLLAQNARGSDVCDEGLGKAAVHKFEVLGIDNSASTLRLARQNLRHNIEIKLLPSSAEHDVSFMLADALSIGCEFIANRRVVCPQTDDLNPSNSAFVPREDRQSAAGVKYPQLSSFWDILISNPPYISPEQFGPGLGAVTARSVRKWEPIAAIVPPEIFPSSGAHPGLVADQAVETEPRSHQRGDEFYPPLLRLGQMVNARLIVLEVGDTPQATRVQEMARKTFAEDEGSVVEMWRDEGFVEGDVGRTLGEFDVAGNESEGGREGDEEGEGRAVVIWRGDWAKWRKEEMQD